MARSSAGQREDNVKIGDWQEPLGASPDPSLLRDGLAFGAVPVPARVVRGLLVPAARAHVEVPAESRGPAALDGEQGAVLLGGQGASTAERRAVEPDDVCKLQSGTPRRTRRLRRALGMHELWA